MLMVNLTDGKKTVTMLEFSRANCINVDTLPGTKGKFLPYSILKN